MSASKLIFCSLRFFVDFKSYAQTNEYGILPKISNEFFELSFSLNEFRWLNIERELFILFISVFFCVSIQTAVWKFYLFFFIKLKNKQTSKHFEGIASKTSIQFPPIFIITRPLLNICNLPTSTPVGKLERICVELFDKFEVEVMSALFFFGLK